MKHYPKGARWYRIVNGEVSQPVKRTIACNIRDIMGWGPGSAIVQPRGKLKWYRFDADRRPDVLIMKALLSG